jgi:hypothetical protein
VAEVFRYQFVRQDDLASDAIALVGAGDFSHVDILLDDDRLLGARSDVVGGATAAGVQVRAPNYAKWSKQVVIEIPCTLEQKTAALDFAKSKIGEPYDKVAILAFVLGTDWHDAHAEICSEFGAQVGQVGGFWDELYSPTNKINPVQLSLVCSAVHGRTIREIR